MNSSKSYNDSTVDTTAKRMSARSRYSQPPSAAFALGNNDITRTNSLKSSKGGINGRTYEEDDDLNSEMSGLSSSRAARNASQRASSQVDKPTELSRQSSARSTNSRTDKPWRTNSASSTTSGSYATADETNSRWAQPGNYEEESKLATTNAVVDMATRLSDGMRQRGGYDNDNTNDVHNINDIMNDLQQSEEGMEVSPMGGVAGTGYGDDDEMEGLSGGKRSSSRSTTDYVKSRLSSIMTKPDSRNEYTVDYGSSPQNAEHDKVRNEALKMLQIADSCLQDSPINGSSVPNSPRSSSGTGNGATGLFRTAGGGLAMRELDSKETSRISFKKGQPQSSISGIDSFKSERSTSRSSSRYDGTFTIGSNDEDDKNNSNGAPTSPNDDTPSLWSSRYSVERQLMAITGGLDSKHMLAKMDMLHSSRQKTKSARGLYRASGYAMDGSGEDYNDYTKSTGSGFAFGGVWLWLRGTLWSDDAELNYDGTTQSLVRREKAMQRRRRIRWGLGFLVTLSILVGVLTHLGNPNKGPRSGGDVNFYVLADEPYDFSNAELLTRELEALPKDAEFVIHLGNVNADEQSRCKEYGFERAAAVLGESPVPLLVIPGDLDWAACGSKNAAEDALYWWDINLGKLEKRWNKSPLDVEHSEDVVGNFAFLHKGVLFISVNMVEAETEPTEVTLRLEQNVIWTKDKLEQFKDKFHAVVILGHAPPSEKQGEYFWPLRGQIADLEKPVLYLHANSEGSFEEYIPYKEAENLKAVQLEARGREGPMKVVVREKGDAFKFERRDLSPKKVQK